MVELAVQIRSPTPIFGPIAQLDRARRFERRKVVGSNPTRVANAGASPMAESLPSKQE